MADPCLFCRIVSGEEPAQLVLDDDVAVGFLDVRPLFPGHVLVVPRVHVETLTDLAPTDVGPYFERVRSLALAVRESCRAQGTFVAMNNRVSQSVPHLHAHVVPRTKGDGLRGFFWPRTRYDDDAQAAGVALQIRRALADLNPPG
ncbi:MAG: HIT family protein [Acidimicrobiales bacterium]